jgi:transcriptional regulator with XRE-family HTH domain
MSRMFENIGKALAILRQERGLSQEQLAKRCRIGRSQVSKYEAGKELMRLDTLEKVLRVLNVEADQLFGLMASLDASLKPPPGESGESDTRLVEDAFLNLHAAIDKLQDAIERSRPPRSLASSRLPPAGAPTS